MYCLVFTDVQYEYSAYNSCFIVLGRESHKDFADLHHEEHPPGDHDITMDFSQCTDDDGDNVWEDVEDPEQETLVYVIRDILGAW